MYVMIVCKLTDLISASKGLMKGDPIIVCVLTMWSSSRF